MNIALRHSDKMTSFCGSNSYLKCLGVCKTYIFGSKASDVFFKGISALALLPDGTMVFEKVLQAIVPLVQDAVGDAIKASQKRVQTRTAAYADKTKGLAPGQKA